MGAYNFNKDKQDGDSAEDFVLECIQVHFPTAYRVQGKEARFDIIVPEVDKTIEVKNDLMAAKTGNLAIEMCKKSGESSGIMISEADYWVIMAGGEMFMIDRVALRQYCEQADHRKVWGGDRWASQMMLVPIEDIKTQEFLVKLG